MHGQNVPVCLPLFMCMRLCVYITYILVHVYDDGNQINFSAYYFQIPSKVEQNGFANGCLLYFNTIFVHNSFSFFLLHNIIAFSNSQNQKLKIISSFLLSSYVDTQLSLTPFHSYTCQRTPYPKALISSWVPSSSSITHHFS